MWELTIYFGVMLNGHAELTTVKLGSYSRYEDCARAAAQEDTNLSVHLSDSTGNTWQRVGLAQCRFRKGE